MPQRPFGRVAAAMITPFTDAGALDVPGARKLAAHLIDRGGCDALVVNGPTGEAPTTTDEEKLGLLRAVLEAVGDRALVTAGVGSASTAHTVALAKACEQAGAHGLLAASPSSCPQPTQEGVVHHLATVADATALPVLLHDVAERTGAGPALTGESLRALAEHPRVRGVQDCAHDLLKSSVALSDTELAYYAGCDEEILPLTAIGATGCVSTAAGLAGAAVRDLLAAFDSSGPVAARERHRTLLPLVRVLRSAPAPVTVKALYGAAGLPGGPVRSPLLPADAELTGRLVEAFRQAVS